MSETSSALRAGSTDTGAAARGRDLLINNGTEAVPYLSCGLPRGVATIASWFGIDLIGTGPNVSGRKRGMESLPFAVSLAKRPNGDEVVTTSCLLCHASKLGDSVIIGLPNPNLDFTQDQSFFGFVPLALDAISLFLTPEENVEMARYRRVMNVENEVPRPDTIGMNPADVMFGLLASHRNRATLAWNPVKDPNAVIDKVQFTDVPAWWNTWRKPNMFYSGFGRGDHARVMMTASMLCLEDTAEAAAIDSYFGDIEAYIMSLRPPRFQDVAKRAIDTTRANRGRTVFTTDLPGFTGLKCTTCHGDSKAVPPTGPLPRVDAAGVGTDIAYANSSSGNAGAAFDYFFKFFNESWYGQHRKSEGLAGLLVKETVPSYTPPPLDGVWATAPYFHNGAVPTLEGVLDPTKRPAIFRRSFNPADYDFGDKVGYIPTAVSSKGTDVRVYDTNRDGYRNGGHPFGKNLTSTQRRDLIEYLKTL